MDQKIKNQEVTASPPLIKQQPREKSLNVLTQKEQQEEPEEEEDEEMQREPQARQR